MNADAPATLEDQEPVASPRRRDHLGLNGTFEELDLGMDAAVPESYLAPPPLLARLFPPRSVNRGFHAVQPELVPSSPTDSISAESLEDLDCGLEDGLAELDPAATTRRRMTHFPALPDPPARNGISEWMVSVTLILLMFVGAAAGALVFHERVSQIVVQWGTHLK